MAIVKFIKALQKKYRKTDHCVSCGKDTSIPTDLQIEFRYYYVEGDGQLCSLCYNKLNRIEKA